MSQTKISVHPQIKKIIQNLDLDLGLELSRYEHSRLYDSALIPQLSTNNDPFYPNTSSPALVDQSALIKKDELEEEIFSDTPHSSNQQTSIIDRILTPWGIFGIIIFFAANLFIFLNLDNQSPSEVSNNQNLANTVNSQANPPEDNNNPQALPQPEQPTIPNTLPAVQETSDINNSSPYPDLKTALFTEINKQKSSSLTKSSAEQKATSSTPTKSSQPTRPISPSSKSDKENQTPTKYYVISNYKNMDEFTRIKKIVPSAFITKIDQQMKIQLAIVENEKEAKKKSQQLKDKGIDNYLHNNSSNAEPGT